MRKLFLKLSALLFVLTMGVSAAWAQDLKVYFASLQAQPSPASTGSGNVKLTWVDIAGRPMEVSLAKQLNWAAFSGTDWTTQAGAMAGLYTLNQIQSGVEVEGAQTYSGPDATAQLIGGTMCAMDGVETYTEMGTQIFMTSFVYFWAETEPAAGSYLASWTFTDPAVSRIDTAMGGDVTYLTSKGAEVNITVDPKRPCFKVLPDTTNNAPFVENEGEPYTYTINLFKKASDVVNDSTKVNNIYAVFNKYLLSNPQAENGHMNASASSASLKVSVDVEGDASQLKANYADFVFPANNFVDNEEGTWTWAHDSENPIESISSTKKRYNFTITFAPKTQNLGRKNATLTIRMAHADPAKASTLNIPLTVDVRPDATADATLYDGKTPTETSGTLPEMITAANGTDKIVVLNRDYASALNVNADVTIDLNGYDLIGALTINGGNVTLAYSAFGGSATSLTVNGGKTIINGGTFGSLTIGASGTVEQNGATITGAVSNAGSLTTTEGTINGGLTSSKTLVMNGGTFKGTTAVTISGGTAAINRGTIEGTTCGLKVTGGAATTKKLAAIKGATYSAQQTGGTLNVECGKFDGPLNGTINFTSGYFKTNTYGISTTGLTEMNVSAGVEYNEGYRYFLGTSESALANGAGVCRIGTTSYAKLEDALAYANNNPSVENIVIFMTNDYTLPAGYYTLPANATIVVPMSDTQSKEVNKTAPRVMYNDVRTDTPYETPTEFRRLTFASGVNMEVLGDIELTCSQFASNEAYTSQPTGPYGRLVMEEGSHMTLLSGSELRAWGYMTGKGETDARRGSRVREIFQLGDWKGAFTSVKIVGMFPMIGDDSDKKIFPVTQYFIQNVESPVKYHPGAVLATSAAVSEGISAALSVSMAATDIAVVGVDGEDEAIFLMNIAADADNTWVRKWYDVENDIQTYEINSGARIGSMVLDMGDLNIPFGKQVYNVSVRLNSAKFDLPLTSNFKIHLLSGSMDFMQNTCLLPGAEVEVDKGSTVSVAKDTEDPEHTGALYVFDADDWNSYAFGTNAEGVAYATNTKVVRYAPSANNGLGGTPNKRNESDKRDAIINVHGTFETATGFVYTSIGNGAGSVYNPEGEGTGGANIFSTNEDAGTFIFNDAASGAENPRKVYQVKTSGEGGITGRNTDYDSIPFYPARLKHGDGTYENTDEAVANLAYCYQNDRWATMTVDGCFMKENRGGQDVYYAKPQEYVAVVATKDGDDFVGNADHTYSDADGAGRLFILTMDNFGGCDQWWEVEKKDNLYHCIHPENDTYYYWDDIAEKWKEKMCTIQWKNWNDTIIPTINAESQLVTQYKVKYGTMAEFFGTKNPTRDATIDYTYDFTGWTPALGPVTQNVTYTATFEQKDRMYTITFLNEGGSLIETQFLKHNDVPVCENTPTKVGYHLIWSPAIGEVIGDQTYTATWEEELPEEWDVTFVNNAGGVLQATATVGVDEHPEYEGSTPAKENADHTPYSSDEYTYTFWGWSAVIDGEKQQFAANVELPCPTAPTTYTAVYTEGYQTYAVKFVKENGNPNVEEDVIETNYYRYGETPVCSATPTKENTPEWTYKLSWIPQIQTVVADASYKADFETLKTKNKYTVSVKSNPSGACSISGAGIYEYNTAATIELAVNSGYTFNGWSAGNGDLDTTITVISDVNLVANFTVAEPDVYITWKNEAGTANLVDPVGQKSGTATIYTGEIPTKPASAQYTYTFDGWTTSPNGAGSFYKNNMTPKATANATYYAHFAAKEEILEIGIGQAQNITEATTVNQLIINSNGTVSGQLTGDVNSLNVTGACYYDLTGTFTAGKWFAVAVPWQVKAGDIKADGNTLSWNSGNYLASYDGSVRAEQGKVDACWKYVSNGTVLEPGHLYMLYLQNNASKLRFPKKSGAPILTSSTSVSTYSSGVATDANWNGIANPAVFNAYLSNTGATVGQVFNADAQSYTAVSLGSKLIVAKPIFVQATNNGSATATLTPPAAAPARRNAAVETQKAEYQVEIAAYGKMQDRLFIQTNDEKESDTYTLGQDVMKFGISNAVAQMWVERYDAKLCMNTMAPVNSVAEFPLSIYAPRTGEYTIAIEQEKATADHTLYLTYNGEVIWNLTEEAYTANLQKGTDANYGLRISAKAPQTATGVDEAIVDSKDAPAAKVLIGNQVFIIRGEKVYSVDGRLIK